MASRLYCVRVLRAGGRTGYSTSPYHICAPSMTNLAQGVEWERAPTYRRQRGPCWCLSIAGRGSRTLRDAHRTSSRAQRACSDRTARLRVQRGRNDETGGAYLDLDGGVVTPEALPDLLLRAHLLPAVFRTRTNLRADGIRGEDHQGSLEPPIDLERSRAHTHGGQGVEDRRGLARAAEMEGRGQVGGEREAEREAEGVCARGRVGGTARPEGEVGMEEGAGVAECGLVVADHASGGV